HASVCRFSLFSRFRVSAILPKQLSWHALPACCSRRLVCGSFLNTHLPEIQHRLPIQTKAGALWRGRPSISEKRRWVSRGTEVLRNLRQSTLYVAHVWPKMRKIFCSLPVLALHGRNFRSFLHLPTIEQKRRNGRQAAAAQSGPRFLPDVKEFSEECQ